MQASELALIYISVTFFVCYFSGIIIVRNGLKQFINATIPLAEHQIKISLIISFRNEEKNLINLLQSIANLKYENHNYEVILVDDHSTDNSVDIINTWLKNTGNRQVMLLESASMCIGKKANLKRAMEHSQFEIIATTDADCIIPTDWLQSISNQFISDAIQMICLPIKIKSDSSLVSRFEQLDFLFLNSVTASFNYMNLPIMCNGAALAIRKCAFEKYLSSTFYMENIASGDDMFLLNFIDNTYGSSAIRFANTFSSGIVVTQSNRSFSSYFEQRVRWIRKTGQLKIPALTALSSFIATINLLSIALLIASFLLSDAAAIAALACFTLKFLAEYSLYATARKSYQINESIVFFLLCFLMYPFVTAIIILISAVTGEFNWKGRKYLK
jgi:glycosyltransferase involved in cell wall biosynthesis